MNTQCNLQQLKFSLNGKKTESNSLELHSSVCKCLKSKRAIEYGKVTNIQSIFNKNGKLIDG